MAFVHRRQFLAASAGAALSTAAMGRVAGEAPPFKISLAQWSFHLALQGKTQPKADPLDFARTARQDFGIEAIEYVNSFYKPLLADKTLGDQLKKRAADQGVRSVLIMCDGEGNLGDPNDAKRKTAVRNHHKWADLAKHLGCHSIRVNAQSDKNLPPAEQQKLAADGLRRLCEYGDTMAINVIVENHGGLSSNGEWLVGVMKLVNHPRVGTLPDFGNFKEYDRYKGVQEMMPYAKGVSAKSHDFDTAGNERHTDYRRMMHIVLSAGYHGYVGIEYEGKELSEPEGVRATKRLLERVLAEHKG